MLVDAFDVFCCLDLAATPALFLFGEPPGAEVAFLFVPPGVVTYGTLVNCGVGDIDRPGERLAFETTLLVSVGGCTVGATPTGFGSELGSCNNVRLLKDVEGRNAPNPSSSDPSFFSEERSEGPRSDGISTDQFHFAKRFRTKC